MDNQEIQNKIRSIESKISHQKSIIKVAESDIDILRRELFLIKWVKISWKDLESWLKTNRPENNYEKNPIVCDGSLNERTSYCKLNSEGKLQIGAFSTTDFFEEGNDSLYVTYNFEPYRSV